MPENTAETFNQYRVLLFSIAYRMLGSATDAEDIVQEAFLHWLQKADGGKVQSPKAYLSTIVVRLCIDQLRSARAQREVYVGSWLPEPILTGQYPELMDTTILAESLSFAFLVMLENLGPLERAVFLLREVFDYDYVEIAAMVGKSEANCRQVLHRAHQHLGKRQPRFDISQEQQERITDQFLRTTINGDMQGLMTLLTDDIIFTGDGGGNVRTALKPIYGPDKVARGTVKATLKLPSHIKSKILQVNGQPAIVGYLNDQPYGVIILDIIEGRVRSIFSITNPDKLRWLTLS